MSSRALLDKLINSLQTMPGVGPVTASRIAFALLDKKRAQGLEMAETIKQALTNISSCPGCHNYSDSEGVECEICACASRRESGVLCVVETPSDVQAIEDSKSFNGTYFVLHGHLSPIDGIGAKELGLDVLFEKIVNNHYKEVILALSQTIEGNATSSFIANFCKRHDIIVSKIASGVPVGGELMSVDQNTLAMSLNYRRPL